MDELNGIAQRLNAEPFNLSIRAVELEEKSPDELLQLVIHVISRLDGGMQKQLDASAPKEAIVDLVIQFLTLHKCKLLPAEESKLEEWLDGISILNWLLCNFEFLRKRCYLANYLVPIYVPEEYLDSDSNLAELFQSHQDLQSEFVSIHKEYSSTIASCGCSASDLTEGIKEMRLEKKKLKKRLQQEHNQSRGNINYKQLLIEASRLRQTQRDEIRLGEQKAEQHQLLCLTKQRYEQVRDLSAVLRDIVNNPSSLGELIEKTVFEREYGIAHNRGELESKLALIRKNGTRQDSQEIETLIIKLEHELEEKLVEFDQASRHQSFPLEKLRSFQKHVDVATSKLHAKHQVLMSREQQKSIAVSDLEKLRDAVKDSSASDQRQELENLRDDFKSQSQLYKQAKEEVETMQAAISELNETKQRLQEELSDLETLFKNQEEKAGVVGFRDANAVLEKAGLELTNANDEKSKTLTEISTTITKITTILENKQKELAPKVQEVKKRRSQFNELQDRFNSQKSIHDDLQQKAKAANEGLEKESTRLKAEMQAKEAEFNELYSSIEALESNIQCCKSADVNELTLKDKEQEELLNELRGRRDDLKENESYKDRQQVLFSSLMKLLQLKAKFLHTTSL